MTMAQQNRSFLQIFGGNGLNDDARKKGGRGGRVDLTAGRSMGQSVTDVGGAIEILAGFSHYSTGGG